MFKIYQSSCEDDWPSCGTNQNIACKRGGNCAAASNCIVMSLDEKFRRALLDIHNERRNGIAEAVGVANMMVLSYDVELEYTATCNVNQCGKGTDECRRTKKYTAGQNSHVAEYKEYNEDTHIIHVCGSWLIEFLKLEDTILQSYSPGPYSHFSQIIWAETSRLGCARSHEEDTYYFVCNYGNEGNLIGQPIYENGTKCSKCPAGTSCNAKYTGLCGEIDMADMTKAPIYNKASRLVCFNLIMLGVCLVFLSSLL
ncbi:hypothetical protein JTB14_009470 [Gonioctena quinquepunctata]|nr:hypothetical protein JTB14_009470 [Gonioctena quinquepunctata]